MSMHNSQSNEPIGLGKAWRRLGALMVAGLVLAGVFMLYLDPVFMVAVADQLWACF